MEDVPLPCLINKGSHSSNLHKLGYGAPAVMAIYTLVGGCNPSQEHVCQFGSLVDNKKRNNPRCNNWTEYLAIILHEIKLDCSSWNITTPAFFACGLHCWSFSLSKWTGENILSCDQITPKRTWLVVLTILKNMKVSWDDDIPIYEMEHKSHVWNHQPGTVLMKTPRFIPNKGTAVDLQEPS